MYAVLFDIDGTLISTDGAGRQAFAEAFATEFGIEPISPGVPFAGRSDRAIASELMEVHGIEVNEQTWQRFRRTYLAGLPAVLGKRKGRVLPGVVDMLDALAEMPHVIVGLLTGNLAEGAERKLVHYGLAGRFSFGGFGDVLTDRCDIAAAAVEAANAHLRAVSNGDGPLELSGAMVIGDTIHDIRCARSIGATAVAVPTGGSTLAELTDEKPDFLTPDLSHHQALLAEAERFSRRNGFRESRTC